LYDFQTRDIRSFAQLKQEIKIYYFAKQNITHIQREFNILQKPDENVREYLYKLCIGKLAMELYQLMIEKNNSSKKKHF